MQHAVEQKVRYEANYLKDRPTHLAKVELCVLLSGNTLDLDEGSVGAGVALCALVTDDASLRVESTKQPESSKPGVFQEDDGPAQGGSRA